MHAVRLRHDLHEVQIVLGLELRPELVLHQQGRDQVRRIQVAWRQVHRLLQELFTILAETIARGLRPVSPPVVVIGAANASGRLWLHREAPLPVVAGELRECLR